MQIGYTIAYALIIIAFLVVEIKGVVDKKKGDTLSENVWWIQKHVSFMRYVVLGFIAWLAVHFFFFGAYG